MRYVICKYFFLFCDLAFTLLIISLDAQQFSALPTEVLSPIYLFFLLLLVLLMSCPRNNFLIESCFTTCPDCSVSLNCMSA